MFIGSLVSLAFSALLVVAAVLFVRWLWTQGGAPDARRASPDRALDVLRERYARGEIDKEEFEAKKRDLS